MTYTYYYYPITALYGQYIGDVWPEYKYFNSNGATGSNTTATSIVMMLGAVTFLPAVSLAQGEGAGEAGDQNGVFVPMLHITQISDAQPPEQTVATFY